MHQKRPEICLELVNHEEFCVDDICECCGKFDSDFDKDVKILWNELLDKGKVSLKWGEYQMLLGQI